MASGLPIRPAPLRLRHWIRALPLIALTALGAVLNSGCPVTSITTSQGTFLISPEVRTVEVGTQVSYTVTFTATGSNVGVPLTNSADWSSSDTSVATIVTTGSNRGQATAVGPGTTRIFAELQNLGIELQATLTVTSTQSQFTVSKVASPSTVLLDPMNQAVVTYTVTVGPIPSGGNTLANDITLIDAVPSALPVIASSLSSGCTLQAGNNVQCRVFAVVSLPQVFTYDVTPTTQGTFLNTASVTEAGRPPVTATASVTVTAPLSCQSGNPREVVTGTAINESVPCSGGTPPYAATSPEFPSGSGTGRCSGMSLSTSPTGAEFGGAPNQAGTCNANVQVTDASVPQQAVALIQSFVIFDLLQIFTTTLSDGADGAPYNQPIITSGGKAPITFTLAPGSTLPAGFSLSASGIISGTTTDGGAFTFTIEARDSLNPPQLATHTFTIQILQVTTTSLQGGTVGQPYLDTLAGTGFNGLAGISWRISQGMLPAGLSIDPVSGAISGIPTQATPVPAPPFTVEVTQGSRIDTEILSIAIAPPPTVTSVTISPGPTTIPANSLQAYTATAHFSDGSTQNVTADPGTTWTSSDTGVATVSFDGIATAVAHGNTSISATFQGVTGTATLQVIVVVTIAPTMATVSPGGQVMFTVTIIGDPAHAGAEMKVNNTVGGNATLGTVTTPAAAGTSNGPSTYTAPAMVPTGGMVTVGACANADLARCAFAQVTIAAPPPAPDLQVMVNLDPNAQVGSEGDIHFSVAELANAPATDIHLNVPLPAAVRFVSATSSQGTLVEQNGVVDFAFGPLPALGNARATVRVLALAGASPSVNIVGNVSSNEVDLDLSNNATNSPWFVAPQVLALTAPPLPDGTVGNFYSTEVLAIGQFSFLQWSYTDMGNQWFVPGPPSPGPPQDHTNFVGNVGACVGLRFALTGGGPNTPFLNDRVQILGTPTAPGDCGPFTLIAEDLTTGTIVSQTYTIHVISAPQTDLAVAAAFLVATPKAGITNPAQATVQNLSSTDAADATLTINLDPDVFLTSATPSQGTCTVPPAGQAGGTGTCTLGIVLANTSVTVNLDLLPRLASTSMTNDFAVTSTTPDSNPANDNLPLLVGLQKPDADLGVTCTESADPVPAGTTVTYTCNFLNNGPDQLSVITHQFSYALNFSPNAVLLATSGDCTGTTNPVDCENSFGSVAISGSVDFTLNTAGLVTMSTSTGSSLVNDPDPNNNSVMLETTFTAASPNLALTLNCTNCTASAGATATAQATVIETNNFLAAGVVLACTSASADITNVSINGPGCPGGGSCTRDFAANEMAAFNVTGDVDQLTRTRQTLSCSVSHAQDTDPADDSDSVDVDIIWLEISPQNPTINLAFPPPTLQFTATLKDTATPPLNNDVTTTVDWNSSDLTKATIQTTGDALPGLATALSPGTTFISASSTFGATSDLTTLTVINAASFTGPYAFVLDGATTNHSFAFDGTGTLLNSDSIVIRPGVFNHSTHRFRIGGKEYVVVIYDDLMGNSFVEVYEVAADGTLTRIIAETALPFRPTECEIVPASITHYLVLTDGTAGTEVFEIEIPSALITQLLHPRIGVNLNVTDLTAHPTGNYVAAAADGQLRIFVRQPNGSFVEHPNSPYSFANPVFHVEFNPAGTVVCLGQGFGLVCAPFDPATGVVNTGMSTSIPVPTGYLTMSDLPDGRPLIATSDGFSAVFTLTITGGVLVPTGPPQMVTAVAPHFANGPAGEIWLGSLNFMTSRLEIREVNTATGVLVLMPLSTTPIPPNFPDSWGFRWPF